MSLFKRLFRDREDPGGHINSFKPQNANIKTLGSNLQKRFSRGVQYNMKILIRGDRNVGKSALLNRLKGQDFVDQYIPTEEIEVACIHWSYKSNEDVVKVEVWDVVDKGRKKASVGLKLDNSGGPEEAISGPMCLDAEFLDVYKGAHGVILLLDMTKSWTFNYVERELDKLPEDLPVLVLANHRDMGHHRTVSADQVLALLEPLPGFKKGLVKYWESSMKNGYGLVYIHRFFNVPFLLLQRDTLVRQLATNEAEVRAALESIQEFEDAPDNGYDHFLRSLHAQKPASLPLQQARSNPCSQVTSPADGAPPALPRPAIHPPQAHAIPGMDKLGLYPLPVPTTASAPAETAPQRTVVTGSRDNRGEIFDFVPEEQPELSSFLDDPHSPGAVPVPLESSLSSEDEEETEGGTRAARHNPMVAVFRDDIDEEADQMVAVADPPAMAEASSSEDDGRGGVSHPPPPESGHNGHVTDRPVISLDERDLEVLEEMSDRRGGAGVTVAIEEEDKCQVDVPRRPKKHHKKHHKQPQSEVSGEGPRASRGPRARGKAAPPPATVPPPRQGGDSSDDLERFLNE